MVILGIDPGYDRLGVAIIDKQAKRQEAVIYSDCLRTSSRDGIYARFAHIGKEICRVMDKFKPDVLSIENLFITKNQKTAMRVAEVRGIIIYESIRRGMPIYEYSPMEIKTAITGDGSSDKSRMLKMIGLLVDLPQKKAVDDEYDAIAVALTCSARLK